MTEPFRAPYQPLLFRQVCILAAITGLLAARFPAQGLLACLLLGLLALPKADGSGRLPLPEQKRFLLFLAAFCLGLAFGHAATPSLSPPGGTPAWVRAAASPETRTPSHDQGVRLAGKIRENTPLAGNRHRLLLEDVRAADEAEPLPGPLVLTWQNPPPDIARAGPGQSLVATLRIRHIRGFANPGTWETESYWRDRGAYFRSRTRDDATRNGKAPAYALEGEASLFWKSRTALRDATVAVLSGNAMPGNGAPAVSQAAAVIPALLFGDRSLCAPETLDLVARATLAHSLALSGMHLGFAAALGYAAAHLLYRLFPFLFLRLPRQKAGLLLALPVSALYLWLGGAPPSLVRAALMLLFWSLLLWLNRPKVLIDGLLWAVALILLFSPESLFDIRLQLSAVSVAGIALVSPFLRRIAGEPPHSRRDRKRKNPVNALSRLCRVAAGMALVSVAAQTAVLPIVLDAFPGTGFWFPLNLLWLPVLGMAVMPLAFAGLFMTAAGLPALASPLFFLAELPCAGLFALLQAMDAAGILIAPVSLRPAFPAMAGYWLLILLIPVLLSARAFTRRSFALFCTGLILAAAPSLYAMLADKPDTVRLRLLDVGQGQSALIAWNSKGVRGRMLIDGGGFTSPAFDVGKQVVASVLTDNAPPKLDWLVNSHPDADHLQGLLFPLETFAIRHVAFGPETLVAKQTRTTQRRDAIVNRRGIRPEIWKTGDTVSLAPGLVLEVLHPDAAVGALSANDNALVLRLVRNGKPLALICGDQEAKGLNRLLRNGAPLEADVLVLPHHGSAGSFSPRLYDAAKPKLALASCGYGNIWNFPAEKVRAALAERKIPFAATADKGQITVTWDADNTMRVEYAR